MGVLILLLLLVAPSFLLAGLWLRSKIDIWFPPDASGVDLHESAGGGDFEGGHRRHIDDYVDDLDHEMGEYGEHGF